MTDGRKNAYLFRSGSSRKVGGVQTLKNTIYSNKAVVIAAGCWSGTLIHDLMRESEILPDVPVKPRKVGYSDLSHSSSLILSIGFKFLIMLCGRELSLTKEAASSLNFWINRYKI